MRIGEGRTAADGMLHVRRHRFVRGIGRAETGAGVTNGRLAAWGTPGPVWAAECTGIVLWTGPACGEASASDLRVSGDEWA